MAKIKLNRMGIGHTITTRFYPAKPPQPAHPAPGTTAPDAIFPDAPVSPTIMMET